MRARTLVVACGNPLRGDDGVALAVAARCGGRAGVSLRAVHQLVPELAEEIARFGLVVIADADCAAGAVEVEPLEAGAGDGWAPFTHMQGAATVLALARRLFGFSGSAVLLRLPARRFDHGAGLSEVAERSAAEGARRLAALLDGAPSPSAEAEPGGGEDQPGPEERRGDAIGQEVPVPEEGIARESA